MTTERYIKRTIYVAKCDDCGMEDIRESNPPRDKLCKCPKPKWVPFKEESAIGPDLNLPGYR